MDDAIRVVRNVFVVTWNSSTDEYAIYTNVDDADIPSFLNSFIDVVNRDDKPRLDQNQYTVCIIWDVESRRFTFSDNCGSIGLVVGILLETIEALPRLKKFPVTDYIRKVLS